MDIEDRTTTLDFAERDVCDFVSMGRGWLQDQAGEEKPHAFFWLCGRSVFRSVFEQSWEAVVAQDARNAAMGKDGHMLVINGDTAVVDLGNHRRVTETGPTDGWLPDDESFLLPALFASPLERMNESVVSRLLIQSLAHPDLALRIVGENMPFGERVERKRA